MSDAAAPAADETVQADAPADAPVIDAPESLSPSADYPESLAEVMGRAFEGESFGNDDPAPEPVAESPATPQPEQPAVPAASNAPTADAIVPAETPAAPTPAQLSGLRDLLRQRGYDASKWKDDESAFEGLVNLARKVGARDEDAEFGRRLRPFQAQFEDFLANQIANRQSAPQQQQQAQPQQPASWWNPPPVPENWRELVQRDEDGSISVREGVRADVARQIEDHLEYHRRWQTKLQTNPTEALQPLFQQAVAEAEERAVRRLQEQQAQQQQTEASRNFIAQNQTWMFARNEAGEYLRDPETGNLSATPAGRYFYDEFRTLAGHGVEEQTALQIAFRNTQLAVQASQQQQQQYQPAAPPAQPTAPVPPTQRAVPPGAGGGRANTGLRTQTPQQHGSDATAAFADAFKDWSDELVRDVILN